MAKISPAVLASMREKADRARAPEQEVLEYTYNSRKRKWDISNELYRIEIEPYADGGHRRCWRAWKEDTDGLFLVKQYFHNASSEQASKTLFRPLRTIIHAPAPTRVWSDAARLSSTPPQRVPAGTRRHGCPLTCVCVCPLFVCLQYFDDAMAQMLSSRYARKFNKKCGSQLSFNAVYVIKLSNGKYAATERLLQGTTRHHTPARSIWPDSQNHNCAPHAQCALLLCGAGVQDEVTAQIVRV
jgi:hypothetical protein